MMLHELLKEVENFSVFRRKSWKESIYIIILNNANYISSDNKENNMCIQDYPFVKYKFTNEDITRDDWEIVR